jgi:hypothetical protein
MPYADSGGPVSMPAAANAAQGDKLVDVSRYVNFFTAPKAQGGVKVDPKDVILVTISAPPAPVQSVVGDPSTIQGFYVQCAMGQPVDGKTCAVLLQHSCVAPDNNKFFGDPAVRLDTVVTAAQNNQVTSICDTDYTSALQGLGQLIINSLGAGCISSPIKLPPDCVVENVSANSDGSTSISEVKQCTGNSDPSVPCSSVAPPASGSCWVLCTPTKKDGSPACPAITYQSTTEQYGVNIVYAGGQAPPNTTAHVSCATIAQ